MLRKSSHKFSDTGHDNNGMVSGISLRTFSEETSPSVPRFAKSPKVTRKDQSHCPIMSSSNQSVNYNSCNGDTIKFEPDLNGNHRQSTSPRILITNEINEIQSTKCNAIDVRGVNLSYQESVLSSLKGTSRAPPVFVLNGLNLTVPIGKIYGLLGPSGCGKTSLLRCM